MPSKPLKVLFIGASDRSGSTLLDMLLGQLPGFASGGELRRIWGRGLRRNELCGCGQPFRECDFWREVIAHAFRGTDGVDAASVEALRRSVERLRYAPALLTSIGQRGEFGERVRRYAQMLRSVYMTAGAVSGARVIVDSSKSPIHGLILRSTDLDVRVIHLVRDSRSVAYSLQRTRRRPEVHWDSAWMARKDPIGSAVHWNQRNALMHLHARPRPNYLRLRYEDFVRRPKATVSKVATWLGEPLGDLGFLDGHAVDFRPSHTVSGNPVRFRKGPVEIRPDDQWEREFDARQRRTVVGLTWPLLLTYGYLRPKNGRPGAGG
jgi:hypothetical protein